MLLFEWIIHDRINTVLQTLAECVCVCVLRVCVCVFMREAEKESACVCGREQKRWGLIIG